MRVDKDDNVWMTDEGSNMVVKFRPDATVAMVLGRKEEPLDWLEKFIEHGEKLTGGARRSARPGVFNRPTDVTWDTEGNIFVSDGYNNSRVAKMSQGRQLGQGARHARQRARTSSTRRTASPPTPRATSTSPTAATAASRCSIPI